MTGLWMPVDDCLWNHARGRNQERITFAPHQQLLTASGDLDKPLGFSWRWGRGTALEAWAHVCPSPRARIKVIYLFPPHPVSVFFIRLWWAGKAKILAGNMPCIESSESSPLDRQGSPSLVFILQVAHTFRAVYIFGITQSFLVLVFSFLSSPSSISSSFPGVLFFYFLQTLNFLFCVGI